MEIDAKKIKFNFDAQERDKVIILYAIEATLPFLYNYSNFKKYLIIIL